MQSDSERKSRPSVRRDKYDYLRVDSQNRNGINIEKIQKALESWIKYRKKINFEIFII
jgi:hypothetical protein